MTRIVYDTATSLNGWIADERHSLDWLFEAGEPADSEAETPATGATVIVEGSTTYEWVLEHEALLDHPERWQQYFGAKPMFVFTTRTLPVPAGADVRFLSGDVAHALPEIRRAAAGGDVWLVGGGELAGQFLDADALDQIALSVAPVALTGGAPLLPRRLAAAQLHLETVRQEGNFARLVYTLQRTPSA